MGFEHSKKKKKPSARKLELIMKELKKKGYKLPHIRKVMEKHDV